MNKGLMCLALATAMAAATATGAYAQKKKLQKRENYEFTFDLPRYVEELKTELTYPLAWGNSPISDPNTFWEFRLPSCSRERKYGVWSIRIFI